MHGLVRATVMEKIYALVEQLDLALDEMAKGSPVTSRFALLLVDNAVELLLHTSCETEVTLDRYTDGFLEAKYDEGTRRDALGQHFGSKVRFCRDIGMMSPDVADFVNTVHGYRNELYHVGLKYDGIILPLAWEYLGVAADLLPEIRVSMWHVVGPSTERASKYFDAETALFRRGRGLSEAAEALKAGRPPLPKPFAHLLSDFAVELVESVDRDLEFLASENFAGLDRKGVLEEIQFYDYLRRERGSLTDKASFESGGNLEAKRDEIRRSWRPEHRASPVAKWLRRAREIADSATPPLALRRFQQLRRDTSYLEEVASEAATMLDVQIQHQIDAMRGK